LCCRRDRRPRGRSRRALAAAARRVSERRRPRFNRAIALDAENFKAQFYLGLAAEQDGNAAEAARIWRDDRQVALRRAMAPVVAIRWRGSTRRREAPAAMPCRACCEALVKKLRAAARRHRRRR
jgi:hypothetical protein